MRYGEQSAGMKNLEIAKNRRLEPLDTGHERSFAGISGRCAVP
jgi:hypothetical protein